ncbi:hypothetical protein STEG23_028325, partial [Scotinomys teguina]
MPKEKLVCGCLGGDQLLLLDTSTEAINITVTSSMASQPNILHWDVTSVPVENSSIGSSTGTGTLTATSYVCCCHLRV